MNRPREDMSLKDKEISIKPTMNCKIDKRYLFNLVNGINIKWMGHEFPLCRSEKEVNLFLNRTEGLWYEGQYEFSIFMKNTLIGAIDICLDDRNNTIINLGYWLGKDFQNKGYATRSVALIKKFCFRQLGVRKIEAGVYEGNLPSQKVLLKSGFEIEGILRKNYKFQDEVLDKILYGILNQKFKY